MNQARDHHKKYKKSFFLLGLSGLLVLTLGIGMVDVQARIRQTQSGRMGANALDEAFQQAAMELRVPEVLLQTICYMEGRLSDNKGAASIDGGYGCMHLVKNRRMNTLEWAAEELGVSEKQIQQDQATNIRAGAVLLRKHALKLAGNDKLPSTLSDWYGAVALYSNAANPSIARMYADQVYKLLETGFQATSPAGERVVVQPQALKANKLTFNGGGLPPYELPSGCVNDGQTEYPGAINCILDPKIHECQLVPDNASCNYIAAKRPGEYSLSQVMVHDIEGTALSALKIFLDREAKVSAHYIVDSDGTVYQVVREKDVAFHAGNLWTNQHSIGIEHAGYAATGFLWYNATEYLASARLMAYLAKKYKIPVDHDHIVSHGTVTAPTLAQGPNHVDPGPYWLWEYYLDLVERQGVETTAMNSQEGMLTLLPASGRRPFGEDGSETPANFNFFYLYNGPSTDSGFIPHTGSEGDITDVTYNIETEISYVYTQKARDAAGTGRTLYKIWYGVQERGKTPKGFANAKQVWVAVPSSAAVEGRGYGQMIRLKGLNGKAVPVSGSPRTNTATTSFHIGDAPDSSMFVSAFTVIEDGTQNKWYVINYNHRQAWVPASMVEIVQQKGALETSGERC